MERGTRSLEGWVREADAEKKLIAPVTLIWRAEEKNTDTEMVDADHIPTKGEKKPQLKRMFIRVHPSAFLQLWEEVLKVSKTQGPPVMAEDLRFELGSIDIAGPGSAEALIAALKPTGSKEWPQNSPEATWPSLAGLSNAASLPQNAILAFNISDPRLHHPPKTVKPPVSESSADDLAMLLSSWPPDYTLSQPSIFSRPERLKAARLLPSQKAINRRRTLSTPGQHPSPKSSDPNIPILILTSRPRVLSRTNNSQGQWTVIMPWKCVLPVWYSIMYYPLSSGGNPRFGGLKEKQQLAFEAGEPWFPGDFPGTRAGWTWESREREARRKGWERKPKGKRVEFDSVDLGEGRKGEVGLGWACDWERLIQGPKRSGDEAKNQVTKSDGESSATVDGGVMLPSKEGKSQSTTEDKTEDGAGSTPFPDITHLSAIIAASILTPTAGPSKSLSNIQSILGERPALATVKVTALSRGTPTPRARIYRLPRTDHSLREKWLSLIAPTRNKFSSSASSSSRKNGLKSLSQKSKKNRLLSESDPSGEEEKGDHLPIPGEEDLIGFITTGNYNLSEGRGTGMGAIWAQKVLDTSSAPQGSPGGVSLKGKGGGNGKETERERRLCIVRTAGERLGRLARWEVA